MAAGEFYGGQYPFRYDYMGAYPHSLNSSSLQKAVNNKIAQNSQYGKVGPIVDRQYQVQVIVQAVNVDREGSVVGGPKVLLTSQVNDNDLGTAVGVAVAAVEKFTTDSNS